MSDRVGQQIGNYRLIQLLGSGGFADVYLARHIYLDSPAAIKVLRANLAEQDLEDFKAEAKTLVRLIHPHIVRLLDFGVEEHAPFLVMDYAPNGTLRQRHQRGERLPIQAVIAYVDQAASALQYAHDQKFIHRDVKPENMLLGREQEILLSDFGIAVVAQSTRTELTHETTGTISYMAPEQIQAHPRPASDQYSLGVVVYEWLSGSRPFSGSFTEVAAKHIMTPPAPLLDLVPSISPEVAQVVATALAKDPKQRFSSVQAFATALKEAGQSQARRSVFPLSDQPTLMVNPPTLPASSTPMQVHANSRSANPATPLPLNTPVNPLIVPAQALNTPGGQEAMLHSSATEAYEPAIVTPPSTPHGQISLPGAASQPAPARRGISRRAVIIAGGATVAVLAVAGVTGLVLSHTSSPGATHNTGGTSTTPTAPSATSPAAGLAAGVLAQDTFHRPNQAFWGTASDGHRWLGDANTSPDFAIAGDMGQAHRTANGHSLYTAVLGPIMADADVVVSGSMSHYNPSHFGVMLRWLNDAHYYKVDFDDHQFHLFKRVGGQAPSLQTIPFAAQPDTLYTVRFRIVGTTIQAKVWQTGSTEPANWMMTATDNTFQSGRAGLRPQIDQNVTLNVSSFNVSRPGNA